MSPDDARHGTTEGYDAEYRAGIDHCDLCRHAAARYEKERVHDRANGRPRTVEAIGSARRIQALVALGYNFRALGKHFGLSHDVVRSWAFREHTISTRNAKRIGQVYDALSMTLPPTRTTAEKRNLSYARTTAARYGWAPPLAWDDIDYDEKPYVDDTRSRGRIRATATYRRAELIAEWDHLRMAGVTLHHAARQLGVTPDAIERAILRDRAAS